MFESHRSVMSYYTSLSITTIYLITMFQTSRLCIRWRINLNTETELRDTDKRHQCEDVILNKFSVPRLFLFFLIRQNRAPPDDEEIYRTMN